MIGTVRIFSIAFLVLVVIASATSAPRLWGAGAWGSVSPAAAWIPALACLALLSGRLCLGLSRALAAPFRGRARAAAALVAVIAAVSLLWRLRCAHFLWGGRYTEGLAVSGGGLVPAAPLSTLIAGGAFAVINRLFFWSAFDAAAVAAPLAALIFAVAALASLRLLSHEHDAQPAASLALALCGGYAAVFFGCGAAIPLAVAASGLFVLLSLQHLHGRVPLLVPALALLAALLIHAGTIFLAGGFLYLVAACLSAPGRRREAIPALLVLVLCWTAADLLLFSTAGGTGLAAHIMAAARSTVRAAGGYGAAAAAAEAGAILLILGPAATLGLVLAAAGIARGGGTLRGAAAGGKDRFLLATAVSAVVLIAAASTRARGGLRWDLFAPAGAVLALFAAAKVARALRARERFIPAAVLLSALGLYHLAPLVATSASLSTGRRRVAALNLPAGRAEHIIGAHAYHVERDYSAAGRHLAAAARSDPDNPEIRFDLGMALMRLEEPLEAAGHFYRALQLEPENQRHRAELAEAYIALRWYDEAAGELEKLTEIYPDSAHLWIRLGYALNHGRMFTGAIAAYERALELQPDNEQFARNLASAVLNRGAELQQQGEFDDARAMYRRARIIYPPGWVALNNLAALEMELENWERAYDILAPALMMHPNVPQLHFNMGLVKERFGEYEEALGHLRKSGRLDALSGQPFEDISRIERKLESLGRPIPPDTMPH